MGLHGGGKDGRDDKDGQDVEDVKKMSCKPWISSIFQDFQNFHFMPSKSTLPADSQNIPKASNS